MKFSCIPNMHFQRYYFVTLFMFLKTNAVKNNFSYSRVKRTLTYIPPGGVIQMVMGVGIPLVINNNAIIMGLVLKGGYGLPYNSSHYTNSSVVYAKRSISRWDIYDSVENIFQAYGLGGKECVLRMICELADITLDKGIGILEEVMHTIFTPSSTNDIVRSHLDNIYYAAELQGKKNTESCQFIFSECKYNFAELFTTFY